MTAASDRQTSYLRQLRANLRSNLANPDQHVRSAFDRQIAIVARGGASAANHRDAEAEIKDFCSARPWLTLTPGEAEEQIRARLVAYRQELANLSDEQIDAMDSRTISRHIDAAKAFKR